MKKEFKSWSEAVAYIHENRPMRSHIIETKNKLSVDLTETFKKLKK